MQKTQLILSEQFYSSDCPDGELVRQAVNLWLKTALPAAEKGESANYALRNLHQTEQGG